MFSYRTAHQFPRGKMVEPVFGIIILRCHLLKNLTTMVRFFTRDVYQSPPPPCGVVCIIVLRVIFLRHIRDVDVEQSRGEVGALWYAIAEFPLSAMFSVWGTSIMMNFTSLASGMVCRVLRYSPRCHTVSYAAVRSTKTAPNSCFSCTATSMSLTSRTTWSVVELPFLNPALQIWERRLIGRWLWQFLSSHFDPWCQGVASWLPAV